MLSRRGFVQTSLLGIGAALFTAHWSPRQESPVPTIVDEFVIVDGWVLLADDLAAVLG